MKLTKTRAIVLGILIGVAVGVLFGAIPGIFAAAIALMWIAPNQLSRRIKIILTVVLVVAVVAIPVSYYLSMG